MLSVSRRGQPLDHLLAKQMLHEFGGAPTSPLHATVWRLRFRDTYLRATLCVDREPSDLELMEADRLESIILCDQPAESRLKGVGCQNVIRIWRAPWMSLLPVVHVTHMARVMDY